MGWLFSFAQTWTLSFLDRKTDSDGRLATVTTTIDEMTLQITALYTPNTDTERTDFFTTTEQYLYPNHPNIIGRDFNCITNTKLDKQGGNPQPRQSAITTLLSTVTEHNLTDIWRVQHPTTQAFTWTGKHPTDQSPILTHIDKFYLAQGISHLAVKTNINPYPHSDHNLITMQLDLTRTPRDKGYWHFNNTLLNNASCNTELIAFWNNWLTKKANFDNLIWWD